MISKEFLNDLTIVCGKRDELFHNYIKLYLEKNLLKFPTNYSILSSYFGRSVRTSKTYIQEFIELELIQKDKKARTLILQLVDPSDAFKILKENTNKIKNTLRITKNKKIA
jgi:hypothetical protein